MINFFILKIRIQFSFEKYPATIVKNTKIVLSVKVVSEGFWLIKLILDTKKINKANTA